MPRGHSLTGNPSLILFWLRTTFRHRMSKTVRLAKFSAIMRLRRPNAVSLVSVASPMWAVDASIWRMAINAFKPTMTVFLHIQNWFLLRIKIHTITGITSRPEDKTTFVCYFRVEWQGTGSISDKSAIILCRVHAIAVWTIISELENILIPFDKQQNTGERTTPPLTLVRFIFHASISSKLD